MFVYLDNSATTKPAPAVVSAMTEVLTENFGNPSSLYSVGLAAEKCLKEARAAAAKTLGAVPEEVFFTSGGTESDNSVLKGVWESRRRQGRRIITTTVEHPAILRSCEWLEKQGAELVYLPVKSDGCFDMDAFEAALTSDTILVSVMHVNNESGAVMPIREIGARIRRSGGDCLFHTDAVQSYGKLDTDMKDLGVDLASFSGHKVHGPKGIGLLYIRSGLHLPAFIHGGGQEKAQRSGTENMPGIAGMGAAAKLMLAEKEARIEAMRAAKTRLLDNIRASIPDVKVNSPENAVCSVLNVSFLGCRGEVILHTLEQSQIFVSTGSACSSRSKGSHVLRAMGLKPEEIEGAIRFSFCGDNTPEQMDYVSEKLKAAVESQRRLRRAFRRG